MNIYLVKRKEGHADYDEVEAIVTFAENDEEARELGRGMGTLEDLKAILLGVAIPEAVQAVKEMFDCFDDRVIIVDYIAG